MAHRRMKGLYYITHINNISSILNRGILSHEIVEKENVPFTRIYNEGIVANRRNRLTPDGRSLWSFANLYFQPRNAMLYQVVNEKGLDEIAIVAVRQDILKRPDIYITTGNAAHSESEILHPREGRQAVAEMLDVLNSDWWKKEDGSKRRMMAECLVPDVVTPDSIDGIYVSKHTVAEKLKSTLPHGKIEVIPALSLFFQPAQRIALTDRISIIEGDMFFSRMQTLTISVNCVGVMGKGLASRAKYQFPDVYVFYQDLCRDQTLKMGRPYLYKRESSLEQELAEEPSLESNGNLETWFLLFPTKNHWREQSDIVGIEKGLEWLVENAADLAIKSLAVPALGCGLGGLEWEQVGPLMCRYLARLGIPVEVYLPAEKKILPTALTKQFLLKP
ncbi:MAG: DUF4433 domain-containing protein [Chloroflexi bacterium]|nr:DUF4433 domain-containing protein [Chloroflexota bacterium]